MARQVAPLVGADGAVVGLDISPATLDVAHMLPSSHGAPIEWRQGDAVHLDLTSGISDLVLCQQGLQFFSDWAAAVKEMRRVLASNGRAVICVWQALSRHPIYESLLTATARYLGASENDVAIPFSLCRAEELKSLLIGAGFEHIEVNARSLDISLPSPELFVRLTVLGAATSIPAFARLDGASRAALLNAISHETDLVTRRNRDGDTLKFSMSTHIAVARASRG